MVDVGSAAQKQQLQLGGAAVPAGEGGGGPEEEKDEEELAADRRANAMGFQGSRHLLKVFLSDGLQHVVGLDTQGVLAACYQQRCARSGGGDSVPTLHSFFAGAKVRCFSIF